MAGTGKKWAIGCGIGCGVFLLIGAILGGVGFFGVKRIAERADGIEQSFDKIDAVYGRPHDYTPPLDGRIAADRMEAYLAARDAMVGMRGEMSATFVTLDGGGNFLAKARAGFRLVPDLFDFIEGRNRILLEHGMGLGEYQYIYTLTNFALLGKDPADGPGFTLVDDEDHGGDGWSFNVDDGKDDPEAVREERARLVRREINEMQRAMTANHLRELESSFVELPGLDRDAWTAQLAAEAASLEDEYLKLLWEDGLPDHVRESLEYYRTRLEDTYDPMTSILELGLIDHD